MPRFLARRRFIFLAALAFIALGLATLYKRAEKPRPLVRNFPSSSIASLQWAPDGRQLKVVVFDKTAPSTICLNAVTLKTEKATRFALPREGSFSELAPDERTVALAGGGVDDAEHLGLYSPDYWVALADARTGKQTARVSTCDVYTLAFSPDSHRLFAGAETCGPTPAGENGDWGLFEIRGRQFKRVLANRGQPVQRATWNRDGQSLWLALSGGEVDEITRDGKPLQSVKPFASVRYEEREVTALALSLDGKTLALATVEQISSISIIDTATGKLVSSWHPAIIPTSLVFSPHRPGQDDQIAVSDEKTVTLYSLSQTSSPRPLPVSDAHLLAFSPDGAHLALGISHGDSGDEIQVWRLR